MTKEETINELKFEQTQICIKECDSHRGSWTECDNCKTIISMDLAIEALEKAEKYKWHDLRKNPDDFPVDGRFVLVRFNDLAIDDYAICCLSNEQSYYDYVKCWEETSGEIHNLNYALAWKEIEPFEEEVSE